LFILAHEFDIWAYVFFILAHELFIYGFN
jgi:hypothetical protein